MVVETNWFDNIDKFLSWCLISSIKLWSIQNTRLYGNHYVTILLFNRSIFLRVIFSTLEVTVSFWENMFCVFSTFGNLSKTWIQALMIKAVIFRKNSMFELFAYMKKKLPKFHKIILLSLNLNFLKKLFSKKITRVDLNISKFSLIATTLLPYTAQKMNLFPGNCEFGHIYNL